MTSDKMDDIRRLATMGQHHVENPCSGLQPGTFWGYGEYWSLNEFKKNFRIEIVGKRDMEIEFDMIGIDASIPNALRRILISEVPSMAIEKVFMYNNTSIIQDEVLSHRLGLIPLKADSRLFEYRQEGAKLYSGDLEGTEQDTLQFELRVKCGWNPKKTSDSSDQDDMFINHKVYTKQMKWLPIGKQNQLHDAISVGPVDPDILIAKLRPGQGIDMKVHAVKGIGRDHAKFSPVATAYYRLLPDIRLKKPVEGEMAERLKDCFSPGVIKIETVDDKKIAKVHDARHDTCSRNVFKYDDLAECVVLGRVKDHFIFSIESVGALCPDALFIEATKILAGKCQKYLTDINKRLNSKD